MKKLLLICLVGAVAAVIAMFVFKVPATNVFTLAGLLLCPLMHLFMMGHGGHSEHSNEDHAQLNTHERNSQTVKS